METRGIFQFEIILRISFSVVWIPMLWVYGNYTFFYFSQCEDRLLTSESDVYRRQILTSIDGLRTDRVEFSVIWADYNTIEMLNKLYWVYFTLLKNTHNNRYTLVPHLTIKKQTCDKNCMGLFARSSHLHLNILPFIIRWINKNNNYSI